MKTRFVLERNMIYEASRHLNRYILIDSVESRNHCHFNQSKRLGNSGVRKASGQDKLICFAVKRWRSVLYTVRDLNLEM